MGNLLTPAFFMGVITVISAVAGFFGKTTLVEWLGNQDTVEALSYIVTSVSGFFTGKLMKKEVA